MAGIFKNLDQTDVRLTPFRAYKRFSGTDSYATYSAILDVNPEDLGNTALVPTSGSDFTTNYKLKSSVWHSIDSQFYRHYYSNAKASFGQINHTYQPRLLHKDVHVLSIPQSSFGEGIEPLSLQIAIDGNQFLVDDIYGNLVRLSGSRYVAGTEGLPVQNLIFSLKPTNYTRQFGKVITDTYQYNYDKYQSTVQLNNVEISLPYSGYHTSLKLNASNYNTSSIVIQPNGDTINDLFNFQNRDFAIMLSFSTLDDFFPLTSSILLQKKSTEEIIRVDENGNTHSQPISRYPYSLTQLSGSNQILFEKSDGYTTLRYTSSFGYSNQNTLTLMRTGSMYTLAQADGNTLEAETFTDTLYSNDRYCTNKSNIYIGANEFGISGSSNTINNVAFFNTSFNISESINLSTTNTNLHNTYGIVARKQGLVIIDDPNTAYDLNKEASVVTDVEYRGTTTIYENEISCTISPGEFGFSNNPTLHYYNAERNQFELQDFATGSAFRPYVSRIGLYNDSNDLIAVGSLSHPIQPPQNVDTTFIIRYDK